MGVITGRLAAINSLACLERFTIITNEPFDNAVACSASAGAVLRGDSNFDWNGFAVGYGYTPPVLPGETFDLSAGDGAGSSWETAESDGAIVDRVKIFCNSARAGLFYYHIWFSAANGVLAPGAVTPTDATTPNQVSSKGRNIDRDGAVTGVAYWDLDIKANNSEPVWTPEGSGWPNRGPGNIDATITWRQHFDDAAALPPIGDADIYKLYVTALLFWEVKWARASKVPAEYVIRNQQNRPEYVVSECQARFSGHEGGVQGYIKAPGDPQVAYWPPA